MFELLAHEREEQQKEQGKAEGIEYAAFPGRKIYQDHHRIGPQEYPAFAVSETVCLFFHQTRGAHTDKADARDDKGARIFLRRKEACRDLERDSRQDGAEDDLLDPRHPDEEIDG